MSWCWIGNMTKRPGLSRRIGSVWVTIVLSLIILICLQVLKSFHFPVPTGGDDALALPWGFWGRRQQLPGKPIVTAFSGGTKSLMCGLDDQIKRRRRLLVGYGCTPDLMRLNKWSFYLIWKHFIHILWTTYIIYWHSASYTLKKKLTVCKTFWKINCMP